MMPLTSAILFVSLGGRSEMNSRSTFSPALQRNVIVLRDAALSSNYFYEQVRFLCNSIGPRLSGSQQAAAAVDYVKRQMMDLIAVSLPRILSASIGHADGEAAPIFGVTISVLH
jgi:hypothetical protein